MKSKIETSLPGPFRAADRGQGVWRLTTREAGGMEIHLKDVRPDSAGALVGTRIDTVTLDWSKNGVWVTLTRAAAESSFVVGSAIVQRPAPDVLQALPLASFDGAAQRFWRRVFRIVRIPGGRLFLGLLARRARRP